MVIEHNFNILTSMIPNSAGHLLFIVDSHLFAVHRNRYYVVATGNHNLHMYHKNFACIGGLAHAKQMGLTYTYYTA